MKAVLITLTGERIEEEVASNDIGVVVYEDKFRLRTFVFNYIETSKSVNDVIYSEVRCETFVRG